MSVVVDDNGSRRGRCVSCLSGLCWCIDDDDNEDDEVGNGCSGSDNGRHDCCPSQSSISSQSVCDEFVVGAVLISDSVNGLHPSYASVADKALEELAASPSSPAPLSPPNSPFPLPSTASNLTPARHAATNSFGVNPVSLLNKRWK